MTRLMARYVTAHDVTFTSLPLTISQLLVLPTSIDVMQSQILEPSDLPLLPYLDEKDGDEDVIDPIVKLTEELFKAVKDVARTTQQTIIIVSGVSISLTVITNMASRVLKGKEASSGLTEGKLVSPPINSSVDASTITLKPNTTLDLAISTYGVLYSPTTQLVDPSTALQHLTLTTTSSEVAMATGTNTTDDGAAKEIGTDLSALDVTAVCVATCAGLLLITLQRYKSMTRVDAVGPMAIPPLKSARQFTETVAPVMVGITCLFIAPFFAIGVAVFAKSISLEPDAHIQIIIFQAVGSIAAILLFLSATVPLLSLLPSYARVQWLVKIRNPLAWACFMLLAWIYNMWMRSIHDGVEDYVWFRATTWLDLEKRAMAKNVLKVHGINRSLINMPPKIPLIVQSSSLAEEEFVDPQDMELATELAKINKTFFLTYNIIASTFNVLSKDVLGFHSQLCLIHLCHPNLRVYERLGFCHPSYHTMDRDVLQKIILCFFAEGNRMAHASLEDLCLRLYTELYLLKTPNLLDFLMDGSPRQWKNIKSETVGAFLKAVSRLLRKEGGEDANPGTALTVFACINYHLSKPQSTIPADLLATIADAMKDLLTWLRASNSLSKHVFRKGLAQNSGIRCKQTDTTQFSPRVRMVFDELLQEVSRVKEAYPPMASNDIYREEYELINKACANRSEENKSSYQAIQVRRWQEIDNRYNIVKEAEEDHSSKAKGKQKAHDEQLAIGEATALDKGLGSDERALRNEERLQDDIQTKRGEASGSYAVVVGLGTKTKEDLLLSGKEKVQNEQALEREIPGSHTAVLALQNNLINYEG